MKKLTYQEVSPIHWEKIKSVLQDRYSLMINSNKGQGHYSGFGFVWEYQQETYTLNLQCIQKPKWMPDVIIVNKLNKYVRRVKEE